MEIRPNTPEEIRVVINEISDIFDKCDSNLALNVLINILGNLLFHRINQGIDKIEELDNYIEKKIPFYLKNQILDCNKQHKND